MKVQEYLRIDYEANLQEGVGPLPQGSGRGHFFNPDLFWPMDGFATETGLEFLRCRAADLLKKAGIRKDFEMEQSGRTSRNMRVVPGTAIQDDEELMNLYAHPDLLHFVSEITGSDVRVYPDPLENLVITALEGSGDTHGEHLDVPPLALIICLEAPDLDSPNASVDVIDADGEVWQSILGTGDPAGMLAFTNVHGDLQLHAMEPGDAYLLRSDTLPHQVLPLSSDDQRRVIINLTYGIADMSYEQDGSALALFA